MSDSARRLRKLKREKKSHENRFCKANYALTHCGACARRLRVTRREAPTNGPGTFSVRPCQRCFPGSVDRLVEAHPPKPTSPPRERKPKPPKCRPPSVYVPPHLREQPGHLTQLHRRVREAIGLASLGFVPEQRVGAYRVDDLHAEKRIIVEVNGDRAHANPAFYKAGDVIVLEGVESYTAKQKWARDAVRTKALEALGFKVIVVWQSDDLIAKRDDIERALGVPWARPLG